MGIMGGGMSRGEKNETGQQTGDACFLHGKSSFGDATAIEIETIGRPQCDGEGVTGS
jgi:hypothetical protein